MGKLYSLELTEEELDQMSKAVIGRTIQLETAIRDAEQRGEHDVLTLWLKCKNITWNVRAKLNNAKVVKGGSRG